MSVAVVDIRRSEMDSCLDSDDDGCPLTHLKKAAVSKHKGKEVATGCQALGGVMVVDSDSEAGQTLYVIFSW